MPHFYIQIFLDLSVGPDIRLGFNFLILYQLYDYYKSAIYKITHLFLYSTTDCMGSLQGRIQDQKVNLNPSL